MTDDDRDARRRAKTAARVARHRAKVAELERGAGAEHPKTAPKAPDADPRSVLRESCGFCGQRVDVSNPAGELVRFHGSGMCADGGGDAGDRAAARWGL